MANKKKSNRSSLVSAKYIFGKGSFANFTLNPILWFGLATFGLMIVAQYFWSNHAQTLFSMEKFRIDKNQISINPPPSWIDFDPKQSVCDQLNLKERTLLEPKLVGEIVGTAKNWPYVDAVKSIYKSKAGLTIELNYRVPLAVVDIAPQADSKSQLVVDREGMVLPLDSLKQVDQPLLIINVFNPNVVGVRNWDYCPDVRVAQSAVIAGQVSNAASEFGLFRIVTYRHEFRQDRPFEIWTKNGGKIVWTDDAKAETTRTIEQKIGMVRKWIAENGSLDQLGSWKKLDVRKGTLRLIDDTSEVAELVGIHF